MTWDIEEFYKEGYFYRGPEKEWEFDEYGFYPRGLGDLIYNTLRKIIETNDKNKWAHWALVASGDLLIQGKRWPDDLDPIGATYRSQFSMTRDPWVAYYACAMHLDRKQFIFRKPPWRLYSPEVWAWRRALLGKRNCYRLFRWLSPPRRDFVKALDNLMWNAYENVLY